MKNLTEKNDLKNHFFEVKKPRSDRHLTELSVAGYTSLTGFEKFDIVHYFQKWVFESNELSRFGNQKWKMKAVISFVVFGSGKGVFCYESECTY